MANVRPIIVGSEIPEAPFPVKLKGTVTKGYGRGSKELGIPTGKLNHQIKYSYLVCISKSTRICCRICRK